MPITVLPNNDPFQGLASQLLQHLMQEKQLQLQKDQQKLQERELKIREQEAQRRAQEAAAMQQAGAGLLNFLVQQRPEIGQQIAQTFPQTQFDPRTLGDATVSNARTPFNATMLPQGVAGPLAGSILESRTALAQGDRAFADAQRAQIEADVAEATKDSAIEVANLQPTIAREELKNLRVMRQGRELQNAYQHMLNTRDPARVNQARALFETGAVTWGQARSAAGLPKDLIPDNTIFVAPGNTQQNAEAMKNLGFARMMEVSHGIINQLNEQGVRLSFLPSLQRQSKSATFDALVNLVAGSEQERLVNAQRMFGDAYRFSLSGQQSSDREALRMLNAIAEQVGDSEETIAQKRALREVMINVTRLKAGGAIDPIQGARMGLAAAKNTGNPETIKLFEDILQETIAQQQGLGGPSPTPTDPSNVVERMQSLDQLINEGFSLGVGGVRKIPGGNR